MKSTVADYLYRVICLRIVPKIGSAIYLTHYVHDLVMGGHTYLSGSGYEFTGFSSTANLSPGVIELDGIAGMAGIGYDQIASGVFDGARAYLFATTWASPVEDEEEIVCSILGKATLQDQRYTIEEMALVDALNQSVGKTYTASCSRTYGDTLCGINLGSVTVTGTLTGVSSRSLVTDSARAEASDWFGAGTLQFTSGPNAGLKPLEVKSFAAGVIETHEPFHYMPAIGDAYSLIKGCRKREADCQAQGNIINFFGFTRIPAGSTYAQVGGQ